LTADLAGKICVITGATSGIGRMAAQALAALNVELILVGRNEHAGRGLVRRLCGRSPRARFEFIRTDLSRQRDVRMLAARITQNYERVDVLMNNAGARFDDYHETSDGIELTFATNHLGHFLLTRLLWEQLVRAPAARIITVSSSSHIGASAHGEWYLKRANYDRRVAYAKSKLANIMFAYELAERLKNTQVTSNAVDPGGVATNFARNNGVVSWLRHIVAHAIRRELVLSRKGAEPLVYHAVSEEVAGVTGKYFHRNHEVESSAASRDREASRRLWDLSVELTEVKKDLPATPIIPL
jgi:NAD(P)-dependent dehydrogenase (short-subunit alcohol dehydrogenase family)